MHITGDEKYFGVQIFLEFEKWDILEMRLKSKHKVNVYVIYTLYT